VRSEGAVRPAWSLPAVCCLQADQRNNMPEGWVGTWRLQATPQVPRLLVALAVAATCELQLLRSYLLGKLSLASLCFLPAGGQGGLGLTFLRRNAVDPMSSAIGPFAEICVPNPRVVGSSGTALAH